jgi:hypothetical protein
MKMVLGMSLVMLMGCVTMQPKVTPSCQQVVGEFNATQTQDEIGGMQELPGVLVLGMVNKKAETVRMLVLSINPASTAKLIQTKVFEQTGTCVMPPDSPIKEADVLVGTDMIQVPEGKQVSL